MDNLANSTSNTVGEPVVEQAVDLGNESNPDPTPAPSPNANNSDNRFKKILVALGRGSSDGMVFERALTLAKAEGSHLMIFHCLTDPIPTTPNVLVAGSIGVYGGNYSPEVFQQLQTARQEEREKISHWLKGFYEQAGAEEVAAEFEYQEGEPGHKICQMAEHWQADLIVIGRRGRTGLSEILLGSVSQYVIHHAGCTVMAVQERRSR
ncbi:universal stress protein [Spirulina subsalsa FACHB-351]|uniref:Universal stress protein n=1 Tax=Spirulina subsalsa FACHB-351 TaxID=234711 RepID=A0ABT3L9C2_9CYAN|nr:universal stress protein [Spirulina subsalsa]MCW6038103.1 universal stress protein [Spirulina subsalsa FACHB-351]